MPKRSTARYTAAAFSDHDRVCKRYYMIAAPNGMVWNNYDEWVAWRDLRTPKLMPLNERQDYKQSELQRAKYCAAGAGMGREIRQHIAIVVVEITMPIHPWTTPNG